MNDSSVFKPACDDLSSVPPESQFLVHACCGPCLEYPARQWILEGRSFIPWFYNPNIHPAVEQKRRLDTFLDLTKKLGIDALYESDCDPEPWVNWTGTRENRCRMCYRRRLSAAAAKTAELGLTGFTTTLLISPFQNHEALIEAATEAAFTHHVRFLYCDLRPFYAKGQQLAREDKLYRQRYCGCLPSIEDSKFSCQIQSELRALEEAGDKTSI
ncbi:MAG: epoxyqueuosine reductase QueH [Clostridia bacterium]|nr:epoxyqueuosine reductase QueH [Clostridia bacterium]